MGKIQELIAQGDTTKLMDELRSRRGAPMPDFSNYFAQIDPMKHEVFNKLKRPDKLVKTDPDDPRRADEVRVMGGDEEGGERSAYKMEPVARIALALQKLIVNRAVSFVFGNPVAIEATTTNDNEAKVVNAIKKVLSDVKERSFNRRVARNLFSCTEVAEIWYPVKKQNTAYGFSSKTKLRCGIFSPLNGDKLFPYFDETGDMVAFSREFSVIDANGVTKVYFETYTDEAHYMWAKGTDGFAMVDGYPVENTIKKIPIVYGRQEQTEWADVQVLIDRLEKLLSNFADTNDYHASPKIFVKGELTGFAKKGESGAILQGDENSSAEYLSWENAPESVKLEIETLLRMIHTITQTPDISFDAIKGIGAVSGVALKLLFMDAHLKVADHQEVLDEYLQRRISIIKAYLGEMNKQLAPHLDAVQIEPKITPYIIRDEAAELKIWTDANGGNPVISQKAAFAKAGLTTDTDSDYVQYQAEQDAVTARQNSFVIGEPTQA